MAQQASFDFGQAFGRAFRILGANFWVFSALILVASIVLFVIQVVGMLSLGLGSFAARSVSDGEPVFGAGLIAMVVLIMAVAFISMGFTQALMAHGAACDLDRRKATFADSWNAGIRHCLPVAAIMLLTFLMVMAGSLFFIVPGIILGVFFSVSAPAQVFERNGVFAALGASWRITEGNRWILFAYYLVAYIGFYIALLLVYALMMAVFGGAIMGLSSGGETPEFGAGMVVGMIFYILFSLAISVVMPQIIGVIPAAAYAQLKSSIGDRQVADTFS